MGDGPEMDLLSAKAEEMGLRSHVTLAGRVGEEKFQYMSASDIYVSTAVHEGFGLVFLEALESGLPVISYDNGGQVDFLEDGVTGHLVKLGDSKSFENRLEELILSPERRNEMSIHNKSYIRNFYIEKCAEQYLQTIDSVLRVN
jgi:glycosyltransferase involved in cell wall biosynthesis